MASELQFEMEHSREQAETIRHFRNLFGYTRESVREAISKIREDAGDDPNDLQKMLLQRADEMQESLDYLEEHLG